MLEDKFSCEQFVWKMKLQIKFSSSLLENNYPEIFFGNMQEDFFPWQFDWTEFFHKSYTRTPPVRNILCGEGVGTSNFRTTTGQFFQNVEVVFLVFHNFTTTKSEPWKWLFSLSLLRKSERQKEHQKSKIRLSTFWFYLWI